jgi:hypothetical protein
MRGRIEGRVPKVYLDLVLAERPAVYVWTDFAHAYGFRSSQDAEEMAAALMPRSQREGTHIEEVDGKFYLTKEEC